MTNMSDTTLIASMTTANAFMGIFSNGVFLVSIRANSIRNTGGMK